MVGWHYDSMDMSLSKLWEIVEDRSLECCSPWDCKELETTERLNISNCRVGAEIWRVGMSSLLVQW